MLVGRIRRVPTSQGFDSVLLLHTRVGWRRGMRAGDGKWHNVFCNGDGWTDSELGAIVDQLRHVKSMGGTMKRLAFLLLLVSCSHKPDPLVARVERLQEVVQAQANQIYNLEKDIDGLQTELDEHKKIIDSTALTVSLMEARMVEVLTKAKPKPAAGAWVDCWTSNGKRNCVDAQGNTSSRNF